MSSSNTATNKKRVGISRSFLNTTNPEIFVITPRPGGYVPLVELGKKKGDESENAQENCDNAAADKSEKKASAHEALPEDFSREFRIQKTVYDSTWTLSTINSMDTSEESIEVPTPLADSIDMLSVALSTVMVLAAGVSEFPEVYIKWTKNYFESIKDDFGHIPPNIQGILNHLALVSGDMDDAGNRRGSKSGGKTVRTTTTVRRRSGSVGSGSKPTDEAAEAPAETPAEVPAEPPAEEA